MSIVNKLRIVVYGWLVVGALLVWHVRSGDAEPVPPPESAQRSASVQPSASERWMEPPGTELRGEANGYRVSAYAHEGAIRQLVLVVPAPCKRSPWQGMQATFDERRAPFAHTGRRFTTSKTTTLEPDRTGASPRLEMVANGVLSADSRAAHGRVTVRVKWVRNGVVRDSCESKPTRWSVKRP